MWRIPGDPQGAAIDPIDLAKWLEARCGRIADGWVDALKTARSNDAVLNSIGPAFANTLVSFLPGVLTPYRHQVEPLWREAATLFGSVAARRGLSAGEVIEEFHELREGLLRLMFDEPPVSGDGLPPLREVLILNRVIDAGVTQASVGHTDLLFFSLIHGSGVPAPMEAHDLEEVRFQLGTMEEEGARIMRILTHADRH
ncbi:MAG: hypothetical protein ACR2QM_04825 [Longimicrobiales bacterium]